MDNITDLRHHEATTPSANATHQLNSLKEPKPNYAPPLRDLLPDNLVDSTLGPTGQSGLPFDR